MEYVIGRNNVPLAYNGKLMDCLESIIRPSITLTGANGFANFDGHEVWSDGENVYYSKGYDQYVLNKSTSTWSPVKWEGMYSFYGSEVWSDGNNVYLSEGTPSSRQFVLDKKNRKWVKKTWNGDKTTLSGLGIWKDGDKIYYTDNNGTWSLDKSTSTWTKISNNILGGECVWTDGKDIYYTGDDVYHSVILDRSTNTWVPCPMTGYSGQMRGYDIFYDGEHAYFFTGDLYRFNSEEKSWTLVQSGIYRGYGRWVWSDGENYYSSAPGIAISDSYYHRGQYVFDKSTETWSTKEWYGIATFSAYENLWSDGTNIYLSSADTHWVLDTSTMTFTPKTWYGLTSFSGRPIWTDGENIYYSGGVGLQYVLDKSTSTWSTKTWNGFSSVDGEDIWTDGENIYWSSGNNQYVLDKSTSTWSAKTWNISLSGRNVWKEGDNIYYTHYVLDKSHSRWIEKTWNGLTDIHGRYVWSDGENTFYSYDKQQYLLHPMSSTWTPIDFGVEVDGMDMWSDGTYMHLGAQCIIDTHTTVN